jgi:hypothetical protein
MRVNVAIPEAHVSRPVLDAALEATTRLNEALIKSGEVPPFRKAVNAVRWKPEPPGDEHFDHAKVVLGRGWGDCDDLAPWHAASLRATGEDRGAKAFVKKSGPTRWHAVVQRSDGSVDDPSREAGMGRTNGVLGASLPLMMRPKASAVVGEVGTYIARPQLALRPVRDKTGQVEAWQARADLPWHWVPGRSPADVAMVSLHASPVSSQAVAGACNGLIDIGEANDVSDDVLDRAAAIRDMADGATWEEIADEYGEEHADAAGHIVGSFFSGITKKLKRIVPKPLRGFAKSAMPLFAGFAGPQAGILSAVAKGDPMGAFMASKGAQMPGGMPGMPGMGPGDNRPAFMRAKEFFTDNPFGPSVLPIAQSVLPTMFPGMGSMFMGLAAPNSVPAQAYAQAAPEVQQNVYEGYHLPPDQRPEYPPGFGYAQQYPPGYYGG